MPTILFVEDEQEFLDLVCPRIEKWGYSIIVMAEGLKAIEYLNTQKPDLVLLDLGLPDISGMKVLLEAKKKYPDLTVWIVSAYHGDPDIQAQARQLKADDFLPKPLDPFALKAKLKEYFENQSKK